MFEQKCFFELYNSNLWSKIDKQAKNKAAMPLLFVLTVSCHPLHHLGLQSHHCSSGSGQFCAKLEETMAKRGKRVDGKIAELSWVVTLSLSHTHMHTHTHTQTHTHSLTLQSIFHVLSKQHPHDLSADFTHIKFLRKPRSEKIRSRDKTNSSQ